MNIFFIFPSIKHGETVNLGIASLCGVIREKGHKVDLFQPLKMNIKELYKEFRKTEYSLCLISSVTNQWPYALKIVKALRKISNVMIIVGGHHATNCPTILEENEEIDAICIGEGDVALGELVDKLENGESYYNIRSMWFRRRDDIVKNDIENLIENLDSLPFPDYSVFSKKAIINRPSLMVSRGCPYSCAYCCNNSLRKLYTGKGKYVRLKSVKRAIEEVDDFIRKYNPPILNFDDDTFVKDKKWLYSFLDEYKMLTKIPFNCNTRPESINEELCQRLKEANCHTLCIGIESGNEELRKKRLRRYTSNGCIRKAFDLAHKAGIKTYSFNMVGIPDEIYENYLDTVRLNREIKPDGMQMTIFYPYEGSELYCYAKEKGIISEGKFRPSFVSRSLLNMKQFPKWKIRYAYIFFQYNVSGDKSIIKTLYHLLRYILYPNAYISKSIQLLRRVLGIRVTLA